MLNLYSISTKKGSVKKDLSDSEKSSVLYHDLFDYPLNFSDLIRWQMGKEVKSLKSVTSKKGFYFLEGREGLIYKRFLRARVSLKKMKIAKRAARIISWIPTVKMVAVTGSLAMENSADGSDIDLMIVTSQGKLWTTRILTYLVIHVFGLGTRKPNDLVQKDKLCLNMWLDESDLIWKTKDRNVYTAHEIAQIVPLVNKGKTYEKFLRCNRWILSFWPLAIKIKKSKLKSQNYPQGINIVEKLAYKLQCSYMKGKVSREVVTPTRALFHPQDWGKVVLGRLT